MPTVPLCLDLFYTFVARTDDMAIDGTGSVRC